MALETLRVRGAKVDLWVAGEAAPRRFEQVDATVRLGRGYHTLALDLTTLVHERDPATYKCALGGLSVSLWNLSGSSSEPELARSMSGNQAACLRVCCGGHDPEPGNGQSCMRVWLSAPHQMVSWGRTSDRKRVDLVRFHAGARTVFQGICLRSN